MKKIIMCIIAIVLAAMLAVPVIGPMLVADKYSIEELDDVVECRIAFNADSAYQYCADQCAFGPRVMNTAEHDACGEWIKNKFLSFGLDVEEQKADLKAYDGTILKSNNIIARLNPNNEHRILLCAHWDSRPWADNDPDVTNHRKPVMGANDGASGVAVMLELARVITSDSIRLNTGIDFVCFDAEDYGTPEWENNQENSSESWALGAQYWSEQYYAHGTENHAKYEYGILLDMVGGEGAKFYKEGMSMRFANNLVQRVWNAASKAGFGSMFPNKDGGYVTDDHVPVNERAGIPCIDIIAYYPDCEQSSFGPTWHTVNDTMEHISLSTLNAVGCVLAHLLSE